MALANATDLKAAVSAWSNNSDLTGVANDFITLAEAGFNRNLRVRGMEATLASTALVSGAITNPTGFLAWKELRYDGSPVHTLEPRPLEWIRSQPDTASRPGYFAINDTQTVCWPQTGSVKGTYYKTITSLTGTATNWLLTAHPDLYLFACLTEAAIYLHDPEKAVMWRQRASALMQELQSADNANQLSGGPLTVRAR